MCNLLNYVFKILNDKPNLGKLVLMELRAKRSEHSWRFDGNPAVQTVASLWRLGWKFEFLIITAQQSILILSRLAVVGQAFRAVLFILSVAGNLLLYP